MDNPKESAAEIQREYMREWRHKNPSKVKRNNQRYWEKKAAEQVAKQTESETQLSK